MNRLSIIGINGVPEVKKGDNIANLIIRALNTNGEKLITGDIVLVTSKIVSKAEGQVIVEKEVKPSIYANNLAKFTNRAPTELEIILRQTYSPIKVSEQVLIMETKHGLICANAGVDGSNINEGELLLLPDDPDRTAAYIRKHLEGYFQTNLAVIITDTFGRPWRMGQTNVAIGLSGIKPLLNYDGMKDTFGKKLKSTMIAIADQIAGASELVMGKTECIPAAIVRGYPFEYAEGSSKELNRPRNQDLFR